MVQGKIVKGIAGFYYVLAADNQLYECKAKGIFRKENQKPLVGDNVTVDVLDLTHKSGNIKQILPRKNQLIRPAVANIDQALIVFAVTKPEPNLNLLDRFLIQMHTQGLPCIICFNKIDIATKEQCEYLQQVYSNTGYEVLFFSVKQEKGIEEIKRLLCGKTTTLAGPSGVGKSSLINSLFPEAKMETAQISAKIDRGKHTTRHSELFSLEKDTFLLDTPGFSSLDIFDIEKEDLKIFYPEFEPYAEACRFRGCVHINEPGCEVKKAVESQKISAARYQNYQLLFDEIKNKKRY